MIKGNKSLVGNIQYNLLAHIKSYILIHTPWQSDIWFKRYEQFFEFQNSVKHGNMSSVLVYHSKSILATFDSFPLFMSQLSWMIIWVLIQSDLNNVQATIAWSYQLILSDNLMIFVIEIRNPFAVSSFVIFAWIFISLVCGIDCNQTKVRFDRST